MAIIAKLLRGLASRKVIAIGVLGFMAVVVGLSKFNKKENYRIIIHGQPVAGKYYRLDDPEDIVAYRTVYNMMKGKHD